MSKQTVKQEVERFAKQHGIAVNGKGGIPLLSKGDWLDCFDDWKAAHAFLAAQREAFTVGKLARYVWDK